MTRARVALERSTNYFLVELDVMTDLYPTGDSVLELVDAIAGDEVVIAVDSKRAAANEYAANG